MSLSQARSALIKAFTDAALFDVAKVQWENMAFTPPSDSWAAVFIVPAQPIVASLGTGGADNFDGFMQVDLNFPLQSGEKDISAKFDALRNIFTAGASFVYQGQAVVIKSCGRSQGRVVNGFYRISATIMFYARINR